MRRVVSILLFVLFVSCFGYAQDTAIIKSTDLDSYLWSSDGLLLIRGMESTKSLDSIVEYNYHPDIDSVRFNKTEAVYDPDGYLIAIREYQWNSDSTRWENSEKQEFTYDSDGNIISSTPLEWSFAKDNWDGSIFGNKYVWEYDDRGNIILELKYRFYNLAWSYLEKIEATYDSEGRMISFAPFTWNYVLAEWRGKSPDVKWEKEWDAKGNLLLYIEYMWDDENSSWVEKLKREREFDTDMNEILRYDYRWDAGEGAWVNKQKQEQEYIAGGIRTMNSIYNWNTAANSWTGQIKEVWEYNMNNLELVYTEYKWDPSAGDWMNYKRIGREYDTDDNEISLSEWNWDAQSNDWINIVMWEMAYDSGGNKVLKIENFWNQGLSQWIGSKKFEYDYDSSGNETMNVQYLNTNLNSEVPEWLAYLRTDRAYDTNGYEVFHLNQNWNATAGEWIGIRKWQSLYDSDGKELSFMSFDWDNNLKEWKGTGKKDSRFDSENDMTYWLDYMWNEESSDWEKVKSAFYYYQASSSVLSVVLPEFIHLYPNPTSGPINFYGLSQPLDIALFSVHGELLKTENKVERIDISDLPPGMYFVKLSTPGSFVIRTVIRK